MPSQAESTTPPASEAGSPSEVFNTFLRLGVTSFGGPIAHLGYFHDELVRRRRWIDEAGYADLVALCQFLPGPASSQVGFSLGVLRGGGLLGGLAAWAAFTLPSALLLLAFAYGVALFSGPLGTGLLHGLKLVAVAIVAQAVWGMAHSLAPDGERASIALGAVLLLAFVDDSLGQIGAILLGGLAGLVLCRGAPAATVGQLAFPVSRRAGAVALMLLPLLLLVPPLAATASGSQAVALFDAFYRSGALVFGGGHVVVPLLRVEVVDPGWVSADSFLAGYGAAQAVPGPVFAFAAYLGAMMASPPNGIPGAAIAIAAIFLPGLLLVYGSLPFWDAFRTRSLVQAAMRGTNAAVVGILGAALYDPVWTSAVRDPRDFALALTGFVLLAVWKAPSWAVVALLAAAGMLLAGI